MRLLPFLGIGLGIALLWWVYPALLRAKTPGHLAKAVVSNLVLVALFSLPAALWIHQIPQKKETFAPPQRDVARLHLMLSDTELWLQPYWKMSRSYYPEMLERFPEPQPSRRRLSIITPVPNFIQMKRFHLQYPEFRDYFIRKVERQPYETPLIWALVVHTFSKSDPFLSQKDAERLFRAFMDLKESRLNWQFRAIEFAYYYQLPIAQEAEENLQKRVQRQIALFPEPDLNRLLEIHQKTLAIIQQDAFSVERPGKVAGKIEFLPGVLTPWADIRHVWVSLAPRWKDPRKGEDRFFSSVTHFPLNSDGSFVFSSLPYKTYRLLLNIPLEVIAEPENTAIVDFPPEIHITQENPEVSLGTIRVGKAIQVQPLEVGKKYSILQWSPFPNTEVYEILFCKIVDPLGSLTIYPYYVYLPRPTRQSYSCEFEKDKTVRLPKTAGTSFSLPLADGNYIIVIRALDRQGNYLSSSFTPAYILLQ